MFWEAIEAFLFTLRRKSDYGGDLSPSVGGEGEVSSLDESRRGVDAVARN